METKKKFESKGILVALLVLITLIATVVLVQNKSKIDDLSALNSNLNMSLEERDSLVNEMANTFDEIEQSLTFIRDKQAELAIPQQEGVKNQKELLVADIKLMNEMLDESSKKIEDLEKKLNASGIEVKSFRNRIAQLTKSIEEQNVNIAMLQSEIEKRDYQIAEMNMQIIEKENKIIVLNEDLAVKNDSISNAVKLIEKQDTELNKVFFVLGSSEELLNNGVLTKEGGFLGIGKKQTIRDDLNQNYFTELDKRNTSTFPVFSKKVKIISQHPESSYSLVYDDDQVTYLEIENPDEFWKLTSYAIIETK